MIVNQVIIGGQRIGRGDVQSQEMWTELVKYVHNPIGRTDPIGPIVLTNNSGVLWISAEQGNVLGAIYGPTETETAEDDEQDE